MHGGFQPSRSQRRRSRPPVCGFWLVDEGPPIEAATNTENTDSTENENKWCKAKAGRATRPMPKQVTLGDFLDKNTFATLQDTPTDH